MLYESLCYKITKIIAFIVTRSEFTGLKVMLNISLSWLMRTN